MKAMGKVATIDPYRMLVISKWDALSEAFNIFKDSSYIIGLGLHLLHRCVYSSSSHLPSRAYPAAASRKTMTRN